MTGAPVHLPVMLSEVVTALAPRDGCVYVDATFGAGGYAAALLQAADCRVLGIDRDQDACRRALSLVPRYSGRLIVVHGCFSDMRALAAAAGFSAVDGVAFDLGVSSPQLDVAERGFSFRHDGPLDMRMDRGGGATAADAVNGLPEPELAHILFTLGEERAARRIARAIVRTRDEAPILRTGELADVVRSVLPRARDGIDPATRTFQALRLWVNGELEQLDLGLRAAEHLLATGGRLVVVAFHSLEDRIVKAFLRARSGTPARSSRHQPDVRSDTPAAPSFRLIGRRALRPTPSEIAANPRARSARLRAAERTAAPVWTPPLGTRRAA